MYALRWDEERIIQGLAVAMCLALLGMAVMSLAVGDVWAAFRNFVWTETGWKGFVADAAVAIALGIAAAKYGATVGALLGLEGAAAGAVGGFIIGVGGAL